jgi:hypothetical protein
VCAIHPWPGLLLWNGPFRLAPSSLADLGAPPPKSIAPTQVAPVISSSTCFQQQSCSSRYLLQQLATVRLHPIIHVRSILEITLPFLRSACFVLSEAKPRAARARPLSLFGRLF